MSSTFGGLEMGRSALNAFRLGMQTVGHNISNMNTEGYSRQRVNFVTATPEDIAHVGQLGQGMLVSDIERIRDEFLDFQFRDVQSTLGYWEKISDLYDTLENYIPEPSSSGIRTAMDTFFTDVQNVQQSPEDTSAREALVTSANSLGLMLDNLVNSFDTYNESVNLEVKSTVEEANRMLHNLAELNLRISNAEALDQNANDLYDQRDVIIDKLSKMMDISYNEPLERNGIKGEFFLSVNGKVLVQGTHVRELAAHAFMWDNKVYYDVQVSENEFDIVSNPAIADALSVGPEGTYQLVVDRTANGVEWTTGGGNAHCLETFAVKSSAFDDGIILKRTADDESTETPRKLTFRTLVDEEGSNSDMAGVPVELTVKIDWDNDNKQWRLRAEQDGIQIYEDTYSGTYTDPDDETRTEYIALSADDLADFVNDATTEGDKKILDGVNLGTYRVTGEQLDFAINDSGAYFQVDMGGQTGYTRSGHFHIEGGSLKTENGYTLIPDIQIPDGYKEIKLSPTGKVSVVLSDDSTLEVGQLELATFDNPKGLELQDVSTFVYTATDGSGDPITGAPGSDGMPQVRQKMLENPIEISDELSTSGLKAEVENDALIFKTGDNRPLEISDYSGMLGVLTEAKRELTDVDMRATPTNPDDALNISGSFRIQVGTQGTRVTSNNFKSSAAQALEEGELLGAGEAGDSYTFRVGVSGDQVDFSVSWNDSLKKWVLSSDLTTETKTIDSVNSVGSPVLTVEDLTSYMTSVLNKSRDTDNPSLSKLDITTGKSSSGKVTQFYIESRDNHLISISDVNGDLAKRMGIVNDNPVITIDVESSDSLITIRNKINEKYQAEYGLTAPEQWVHASIEQDIHTKSWYLTIAADVAGEAQRITLMGSEDGNMQVLRRLGLTANQEIPTDMFDDNGDPVFTYREVAYIPDTGLAQDASFSLNNVRYLSSDNMFSQARRIPATTGTASDRYSATVLSDVSEGMRLNLKEAGSTTITVRHHIKDGTIKALEEIRDSIIPGLKESLDDMAYSLANHMNAYNYSGYGIGGDITTTGSAFFNQLGTKANAAQRLAVTDATKADPSLIGAAMGIRNDEGKATKGVSGGSGDGTNASRMVSLNFDKVLKNGSMTLSEIYDAMLTKVGSESASAKLLYTTESTVSEQINAQRQAVSGVNLDEELMDMIILNRAFGAMSRYITTYDEMLDKIINGFGLVGR